MCGGGGGGLAGIGKAISGAVSGIGRAVSTIAKNPIFQAVAPIALNFFVPGLGVALTGALGMSAAFAPALMGAVTGGAMGLLGGKSFGSSLKGAAIGGLAAGVADFAMTGNNPLSGVFGGAEGGAAANPLTAGGVGSTNLTGAGSGLGVDKSTIGTQFGLNPEAGGSFGSLTPPSPAGAQFGSLTPPASPGASSLGGAAKPGGLSGLWDSAKGAASKLIPESMLGKVALGGAAVSALGGMGGAKAPEAGGAPPPSDPSFTQKLPQYNYNRNEQGLNRDLNTYGQGANTYNPYSAYGGGGSFRASDGRATRNPREEVGEHKFFDPTFTNQGGSSIDPRTGLPVARTQSAASGGLMQYAMGGYAEGGLSGHGFLKGPGDGVSDGIEATIGDEQPARLAGGEFVIPARIVSEIGNGSSEAGASRLEEMLKRINERRVKNKDYAKDNKSYNLLPA